MDDGSRESRESTLPYEEEFLFHLSRGSEFLVENHVERAKEELERALRYQPHDAKGQDLLASVYFRLGLYPRAIEIWARLARAHPNDLALRVNLGLVLLKTGQPEDARANFQRATEIDPSHARAYRYLGLAEWRCGNLDRARASFLRGGEVTMARRMEEMLSEPSEPPPPMPVEEAAAAVERAEVRSAAGDALERFSTEAAPLSVEGSTEQPAGGPWHVVEQGRESVPRTSLPERTEARGAVESLGHRLAQWSIATPHAGHAALSITPGGLLAIASREPVAFRHERVRAAHGAITTEPIARRARGHADASALLGGGSPIVCARAGLHAVVAPPEGLRFVAVALTDDGLFVVESALEAFDASLTHESARVGQQLDVVSLRGTGIVVLRLRAEPAALEVRGTEVAHAAASALIGWTGRLFPIDDAPGPMLAFRGEGTLLVL